MLPRTYIFQCPNTPSSCTSQSVTLDPGSYSLEVYGASGSNTSANNPGGKGGYSKGMISIKTRKTLYLFIGGTGSYNYTGSSKGGWNGGGDATDSGGSGGGGTDIRTINGEWYEEKSLKSRIIVAGGGGGAYQGVSCYSTGGDAGGKSGKSTENVYDCPDSQAIPCYGTQTGCEGTNKGVKGELGRGGSGQERLYSGGGGGYYGGGAGLRASGGGSGYVKGLFYPYMEGGVNWGNGRVIITKVFNVASCKNKNSLFKSVLLFTFVQLPLK